MEIDCVALVGKTRRFLNVQWRVADRVAPFSWTVSAILSRMQGTKQKREKPIKTENIGTSGVIMVNIVYLLIYN